MKKKVNLQLVTFTSHVPFLKKLVNNGQKGKGRGHRRKRKKGGKEGDSDKQRCLTTVTS